MYKGPKTKERKDVYWAIRPLLQLCKVLGLAPFPLDRHTVEKPSCRSAVCYSAAILFVSSIFTVLALACDLGESFRIQSESTVSRTVGALWNSVNDVIGVFGVAVFLLRRTKFRKMLQGFVNYDDKISISAPLGYEKTRKSVKIQLLCLVGIVAAFGYSVSCRSMIFGVFERLIAYYWLSISMLQDLNFYNTLRLLHRRIECLNELVSESAQYCFLNSNDISRETAQRLVAVWETLWMDMYRLCRVANEVYGVQMVLLALLNVLNVTFVSYFAFIYSDGNFWNAPRLLYFTILWVAVFLIGTILIVDACEDVAKEADHTGSLVSEALLKVKDYKIRRELRLFSHQLLHTKIRFTACGFFSLDFGLLTSMSAAVVTHLVILVQFQLSGKEEKSTCHCNQYEEILMSTNSTDSFS